ncbi:MAG: hypothetical protein K2L48_04165 [Mycoplasmoidaceae bacterium]|nr:hypothetical protein [Mycoplasmoidaceae bacterium]
MIGTFYNKNSLKDTLIINVSSSQPTNFKEEQKYSVGFDQKNNLCFINIFNFSNYLEVKEGFIKYSSEINNVVNKICNIDLSEHINDNDFIVAEVVECDLIEGTHLHKCKVFNGTNILDIVCGAKNVRRQLKVVLAQVGAILPNGLRINKGKLLNYDSFGMLCSKKELNINSEEFNDSGIVELDNNYQVGQKFDKVFA